MPIPQAHDGPLGRVERRVMSAITACRTAVLGGHVEACDDCGVAWELLSSAADAHVNNLSANVALVREPRTARSGGREFEYVPNLDLAPDQARRRICAVNAGCGRLSQCRWSGACGGALIYMHLSAYLLFVDMRRSSRQHWGRSYSVRTSRFDFLQGERVRSSSRAFVTMRRIR
jgi:hypothetical protein